MKLKDTEEAIKVFKMVADIAESSIDDDVYQKARNLNRYMDDGELMWDKVIGDDLPGADDYNPDFDDLMDALIEVYQPIESNVIDRKEYIEKAKAFLELLK